MKISNIEVYGFEAAVRGMRNPRDSQSKSDSTFGYEDDWIDLASECPRIGPRDLKLMQTLIKRGGSHRKFLRMIQVWCDLTLPRFVWVDLDTYKIGTVKNCQSSAHVLGIRALEQSDFEGGLDSRMLDVLNEFSLAYRGNKTPARLHALKRHLPESFLQTATYSLNYETALAIYHDRHNHILPEFSGPGGLCEALLRLPYMEEFVDAAV